jgi:uncharacterized protein
MSKLILLLIVAALAYAWWKKSLPAQSRRPAGPGRPAGRAEPMQCCARCGVHFPAGEAVERDGAVYCSAAHAREGAGGGQGRP